MAPFDKEFPGALHKKEKTPMENLLIQLFIIAAILAVPAADAIKESRRKK